MVSNFYFCTICDLYKGHSTSWFLFFLQIKYSSTICGREFVAKCAFLVTDGPFTIFAPTDEAFAKIPEDALNALLEDKDMLTKKLLKHVVPMAKFAKGIVWEQLDTAGDDKIATHVFKGGYTKVVSEDADGNRVKARIVDPDLICSNGVVHAIDTVI